MILWLFLCFHQPLDYWVVSLFFPPCSTSHHWPASGCILLNSADKYFVSARPWWSQSHGSPRCVGRVQLYFFNREEFPPEKHDFHQHCETFEVDIGVPLKDLLLNLPEGDRWEDAKLMPCLYVLKSKLLKVPDDYKDVLFDLFPFKKPWSRMINSDQLWSSIPIHFNSIQLNSGNLLIQRRPAVAKSSLGVHEAFRIHSELSFVQKITKLHKIMLKGAGVIWRNSGVIWRNSGVIIRNGILKNLYRSKPMDLEDLASASCHEFGNFSPGS